MPPAHHHPWPGFLLASQPHNLQHRPKQTNSVFNSNNHNLRAHFLATINCSALPARSHVHLTQLRSASPLSLPLSLSTQSRHLDRRQCSPTLPRSIPTHSRRTTRIHSARSTPISLLALRSSLLAHNSAGCPPTI